MTTLADKLADRLVEAGARAARNSKAWPEVFSPGSAELLTRAVLLAVLPMVAEDIHAIIGNAWCVGLGDDAESTIREALLALAADLAREG